MMIAPNSRAHMGEKERGGGEGGGYRGMMMIIALNSLAHMGEKVKGEYREISGEEEGNVYYR